MKRRRWPRALAAVGWCAAAGCVSAGAPQATPKVTVPTQWTAHAGSSADERALITWWTTLNDPVLSSLVARATRGSLDVQTALARVREARARHGLARAELLPSLSASDGITHSRGPTGTTTDYSIGFDASWELDLFGQQRAAASAAEATVQARVEDVRDAAVTLVAEVARQYLDIAVANNRLTTAEQNLGKQTETYEIARFRSRAGLATEIDVQQARTNVEQTRATIPALRTSRGEALHRIAILLGQPPGSLDAELGEVRTIPVVPVAIAIGVPADVLRRRPDVRRAERELAAQVAQVRSANAARYPKLTLSGSIGLESLSFSDLLSTGALALTAAVRMTQPLFDAGRIRQNIAVQNALEEQAALAYEAQVLAALEDVENAVVAFGEEQARRTALIAATDAAREAATLAAQRYRSGLVDFQVVLSADRALLVAQDDLAVSSGAVAADAVRLFKAAGGGWSSQQAQVK